MLSVLPEDKKTTTDDCNLVIKKSIKFVCYFGHGGCLCTRVYICLPRKRCVHDVDDSQGGNPSQLYFRMGQWTERKSEYWEGTAGRGGCVSSLEQ